MCASHRMRLMPGGRAARAGQAGTTMVELITTLFLAALVLLGLGYVYAFAVGLWARSEAKMSMHFNGTYALAQMASVASEAQDQSITQGTELRLTVPASLLDDTAKSRVRVFRLKDNALWMDGLQIVPSVGDSGIGVAGLHVADTVDAFRGTRVLNLGVRMFARGRNGEPEDTMWFETSVHLRNRLAAPVVTGNTGGGFL